MITPVLPTYARIDIAFVRGEGASLYAEDGTRYLDFGGGIAVNALGHAHPHLVKTLSEQAGKLWRFENCSGDKMLMTVPPYLARSAGELLLPREVVEKDQLK